MWCRALLRHPRVPMLVWWVSVWPLVWGLWAAQAGHLGANPAEALIRGLGDWTLRLLCLTLAITPLRVITGWAEWARLRRTLGLCTFAYACLHALAYGWFDMGFEWRDIGQDVVKRPFIGVGALSWGLLLVMAITSVGPVMRALGGRRWRAIHRSIYGVAGLVLLHFAWMRAGKHDFADVWWYGGILGLLLGWRLWRRFRGRH